MRFGRFLLLLALLCVATGCAGEGGMRLTTWSLTDLGGASAGTVKLPAHIDQVLGDRVGRYTLRTHVELPPVMHGEPLTLVIDYFGGISTLRANGLDAPDADASPLEVYRALGSHRFLVPAAATAGDREGLDLELTVEHRWTQSGWIDTVPRLCAGHAGDGLYTFVSTFDRGSASAALAMILLVGVAYGIVFLADRRRSAFGWFVLSSFSGASYAAFTTGVLQPIFGSYDLLAVGFLVTMSSVSAIQFSARVFDRKASPWWWALLGAWCIAAAISPGPFRATRFVSPFAVLSMVVAGGYGGWLLAEEWKKRRPPLSRLLATVAWPVVCVLALDDFASWLSQGELYEGARGASLGTMIVSLLQAAALSAQLMDSLRTSDALNTELARRVEALEGTNAEVHKLNEEMRHQITNRSRELAETLARVGTVHLPVLALEPGMIVGERYRVVGFIGSGGMSWVYEVVRTSDERRLALKLLQGKSTGEALSRFAREARLASEVDHPGIVAVVDVDMTPDGVLYLVMEYVDGQPLERYLDGDPAIHWSLVVLRQIAEALAAVHARGIVHRDLKPANVLVEDGPGGVVAKIADFGVSSLLTDLSPQRKPSLPDDGDTRVESGMALGDGRVTRAGQVMGTPLYMAPELAHRDAPVHPSLDMYAFGIMAHELLVGRPPFKDPLYVRKLHGRSMPPPPSLAVVRPRLDRNVADIIDRCLSLSAAQRPSAREAAAALANVNVEGADPSSVPSIRAVRA